VLRYPRSTGLRTDLSAMPLEEAAAWRIADSPVRQEILDRLGEGQSAVWVLLESGDKAADDAAEKLLKERLDYLLGVLSLPQLDAQDIANAALFLAAPESGYINGHILTVDGGWTAR
jgi:NAD(P)-dependent dehydrogenase (short-subunit alcohol dehydrogenase family)